MRGWRSTRTKARADADAAVMLAVAEPAVAEPAVALLIDAPGEEPVEEPLAPVALRPAETAALATQLEMQSEILRLLEVVTGMCDRVIEFIEDDRTERRLMLETLAHLGRIIADGAQPAPPLEVSTEPFEVRERVIGGSMPARPEPVIDLRDREPETVVEPQSPEAVREAKTETESVIELSAPERDPEPDPRNETATATATEIAVEVRGRFGDRWVDGFEICEVMTTPDGPRYRLRRHRDGVVLPELFDATSIRHVETFDQLNGSAGYWSRS